MLASPSVPRSIPPWCSLRPWLLAALVAATGCDPWTPTPTPTPVGDDDDVTEPPTGAWSPASTSELLRNPDAGWVATNRYEEWPALVERAGGNDPFASASVIVMSLSAAEWVIPNDGSSADHAASGWVAARAQAAMDAGRYVALRIGASTAADLPSGWPTHALTGNSNPLPDASIELLTVDSETGPIQVPNWADPDYRNFFTEIAASLGGLLASGPGLAWVEIGGVGVDGTWELTDRDAFFDGSPPLFSEQSWGGTVLLYASMHEDAFPGVPLFVPDAALRHAGSSRVNLQEGFADDGVGIRSGCMGGCVEPDPGRWPGEDGAPYPADDPYGGFLAGELWNEHPVLLMGGRGSLGGWRLAGTDGSWDEGTFGPASTYPEDMLQAAFRHAPPDLFVYADTSCTSEWAGHSTPGPDACANQTGTTAWPVLSDWGRQLGYRYVVTEVRGDREVPGPTEFVGELDVSNQGGRPAGFDRPVELAWLVGGVAQEVTTVTPVSGTSAWGPGDSETLTFRLSTGGLGVPGSRGDYALAIRVREPRAFGGAIQLAHPGRTADGWHPLVEFED